MLSRRGLFGLGAAGLLLPKKMFAATKVGERKFIFVFCPGGWDVVMVYAPIFAEMVDHFESDEAATVNGFSITDSPTRPSVRAFFENWGSQLCLINGMQVPSVAHDVCTLLTMTGETRRGYDDWLSIIAANAENSYLLPNLHVSGPLFPNKYATASVRVGSAGQLPKLVNGSALVNSETPIVTTSASIEEIEEAYIRSRVERWSKNARPGSPQRYGSYEELALWRAEQLPEVANQLEVADGSDLNSTFSVALAGLTSGLSRTSIVADGAGGNGLWDTHSGNDQQDGYFESLFEALNNLLANLAAAPGEVGGSLLDETTVVVLSEMGRTPQRTAAGGKDHWTWTSAMVIGSGVVGGQTIGSWNEDLTGNAVDLGTGEVSDSGEVILPGHLGATLLALADIDPGDFVASKSGTVIDAMLA